MANQDPQPEIYSTSHTFAGAAAAGTSNQVSIFTNQANNEEVRLYAIGVEMLDATTGAALTTGLDYDVAIQVGPNNQCFLSRFHQLQERQDAGFQHTRSLSFPATTFSYCDHQRCCWSKRQYYPNYFGR